MIGRPRRDAGFTLVEVLLAVAILGIGVLVIVGGMMTSIKVSDQGRRSAEALNYIRAYAESVAGETYKTCATSTDYASYTPPAAYSRSLVVSNWDAATKTFPGSCPAFPDSGLQRITLTITAPDSTTEVLTVAKRI